MSLELCRCYQLDRSSIPAHSIVLLRMPEPAPMASRTAFTEYSSLYCGSWNIWRPPWKPLECKGQFDRSHYWLICSPYYRARQGSGDIFYLDEAFFKATHVGERLGLLGLIIIDEGVRTRRPLCVSWERAASTSKADVSLLQHSHTST